MSPQNLRSIVQYLKGLDMPAGKQEILDMARRNGAPKDVTDSLEQIPDKTYEGMDDVWQAAGKEV